MKKPWYQILFNSYLHWIILGVMLVSSIAETIANLGLISQTFTYIGTIAVLTGLIVGYQILRIKPIPWITEDGQKIFIKSLNIGTWLIAGGIVLALWIPRFASNSQQLSTQISTTQINSNPTPNAYQLKVETLIEADRTVLDYEVVNLDGIGPDEIVIRWEYRQPSEAVFALGGLDVVAWFDNDWKNVFQLKGLENNCGVYWGEFGVINLLNDQTRQVATWLQCGTGSFLSLEIYKYQGLGFLERIYKNPDVYGESETQKWMESIPLIVNENLYVYHATELYKYSWVANQLIGEKTELDLGSSGVKVDLWMDENGQPQASPNLVTIKIGQYLYFNLINDKNLPWDTRIQICCDSTLKFESSHLLRAMQEGVNTINLWGWEDKILVTVTVVK